MVTMRALLGGLLALLMLSSCSSGDDQPSSRSVAFQNLPACSDVWIDGATLPGDYPGACRSGPSTAIRMRILACSNGQRMPVHDDRFWVFGHSIHEGTVDELVAAVKKCQPDTLDMQRAPAHPGG